MIQERGISLLRWKKTIVAATSTDFALIRQDGLLARFQSLAQSS
jgi:hypothetical protein